MSTKPNAPWKVIIFDWDGTLMDSAARIVDCLRAACLHYQFADQHDDAYKNIIGLGLREALRGLHPNIADEQIEQLAQHYRQQYLFSNTTPSQLFNGVPQMLEALEQAGYWLAIATGKGREGLDQVLQQTGLQQRFHVTRCASETRSKPHPQMLQEILDQLSVVASDALMIGDTEYDMEMAQAIGMPSLAVSYGVHQIDRLKKYQPLACVDNIAQLQNFLLNVQPTKKGTYS